MSRLGFSPADLGAIAAGGLAGATLRWLVMRPAVSDSSDGGWFVYEPSTAVTSDPVGKTSNETIAFATGLPVDTLIVNVLGCLLLGALTVLLSRGSRAPRRLLVALATGFCGSLTTFSTFAVEVATLLRASPVLPTELTDVVQAGTFERDLSGLALYLTLSMLGGALAFWLGRTAARGVSAPTEIAQGGTA